MGNVSFCFHENTCSIMLYLYYTGFEMPVLIFIFLMVKAAIIIILS